MKPKLSGLGKVASLGALQSNKTCDTQLKVMPA